MSDIKNGVGLDVGTNAIVSAKIGEDGTPIYKKQRDCFLKITPKSEVNKKSIRMALESRKSNFIVDGNDFVVVGEDALRMANERNTDARRPMNKGVLSPKEKDSLPIIKLIIKSLIGQSTENDKIVFSIPADPIDGDFDIKYHEAMVKAYLKEMGYDPSSLNEAFAIAFSELLEDSLTGMCISMGAGMQNIAVCYQGDPVVQFSITKGGDWIDKSVGQALDLNPSLIQIEKEESNLDLLNPTNKIQEALVVYYNILINYVIDSTIFELKRAKLPSFREPIPVILSGGLTLATNLTERFRAELEGKDFPFKIKEVRRAADPMTCVSHGCLMAAIL
jgi:hypothetical protein